MMNQCSHGATMASLNQAILERIELPVPPLNLQRRIAGILGDSQLTTFIGDVVFARPMAYQVSRTVLEMIVSLKEKGGTTTWWPP